MKIEINMSGITIQGEARIQSEMVLCGGQWNAGVTVSGFFSFLNEAIAYAINEGAVLFDQIETEASGLVEWKVIGASSKELVLLNLMSATPAPGLVITTKEGTCFTVDQNGTLSDGDLSLASLGEIKGDFIIGDLTNTPKTLANTLTDLGFELTDTGGGVKAWHLEVNGFYVLLTEDDGSSTASIDVFDKLALFYYANSQNHSDHIMVVEGFWDAQIAPAIEAFRSGAWQSTQPAADKEVINTVATAGEFLIRAAAVLGTLTPPQLEALRKQTDGGLPDTLAFSIESACKLSGQLRTSLKTHPPKGFTQHLK